MKVRILIPTTDGHDLENSVPFNIPILPPFGTRLRMTRETLLEMENVIYNHNDISLFQQFLYGNIDIKNMANSEIRKVINKPDYEYKNRDGKLLDILFDDYDAVVDVLYDEKDQTFYLVIGCAYSQLVLHETP